MTYQDLSKCLLTFNYQRTSLCPRFHKKTLEQLCRNSDYWQYRMLFLVSILGERY
jgi:hypothetical protein